MCFCIHRIILLGVPGTKQFHMGGVHSPIDIIFMVLDIKKSFKTTALDCTPSLSLPPHQLPELSLWIVALSAQPVGLRDAS